MDASANVAAAGNGPVMLLFIIAVSVIVAVVIFLIFHKSSKDKSENLCPKCGKPVKMGKNFCTSCGAKIE